MAFDWNSSGLTTILIAALKEAIRGQERALGIFICGGKGKTSRQTPDEIRQLGEVLALPETNTNILFIAPKWRLGLIVLWCKMAIRFITTLSFFRRAAHGQLSSKV